MSRDLYEFVAATTDVPWLEAEACGWFNCSDAGGWLRQIPDGALLIEAGELEDSVVAVCERYGADDRVALAVAADVLAEVHAAAGKPRAQCQKSSGSRNPIPHTGP